MSRLRVESFAISVDGHGAGPAQSLEQPLGVGGMAGGTVFHFVTAGIEAALARAADAANGLDVRLGGGVATVRQYLRAGLVDELHIAIAPVFLGAGESLFTGLDLPALGYRCTEHVPTVRATHVIVRKTS